MGQNKFLNSKFAIFGGDAVGCCGLCDSSLGKIQYRKRYCRLHQKGKKKRAVHKNSAKTHVLKKVQILRLKSLF